MASQSNASGIPLFGMSSYQEKIKNLISQDRNILVMGLPGVGKSALIRNMCVELKQKNKIFRFYQVCDLMYCVDKLEELILEINQDQKAAICDQKTCFIIDQADVLWEQKRYQVIDMLQQILGRASYVVIVITSRPWFLKDTFVKYYEKVYIELPTYQAKLQILKNRLQTIPNKLTAQDIQQICKLTEGFTCSDLTLFITDASYQPLRNFMKTNTIPLHELDSSKIELQPITYQTFMDRRPQISAINTKEDHDRIIQCMK